MAWLIPILTLFGITAIRLIMGLHHGFDTSVSHPGLFLMLPLVWVRLKTPATLLRLNRKLLKAPTAALTSA
jgi:hypothetical protein